MEGLVERLWSPRGRYARTGCVLAILPLLAAALPGAADGQVEVAAGVVVEPDPSVGSARGGPLVSLGLVDRTLGFPLRLEASVGRIDFSSLGQDYHDDYYLFVLGSEWFPLKGATSLGLRLGLGASGAYQTSEANPSWPASDNWVETVVPGLVLERVLGSGRRVVVGISDHIGGYWFAILDPEEYGIEHLLRITVGLRFR